VRLITITGGASAFEKLGRDPLRTEGGQLETKIVLTQAGGEGPLRGVGWRQLFLEVHKCREKKTGYTTIGNVSPKGTGAPGGTLFVRAEHRLTRKQ